MLTTYIILSVLAVSAMAFVGVLVLPSENITQRRWMMFLVALSAGALLGDAFIHIIPEAGELAGDKLPYLILAGIVIFFALEKWMHWHHHEGGHSHSSGRMILVGDGLHNLLDGVVVASAYLGGGLAVGLATTLAVAIHELPQEIGDYAVLRDVGYTRRKALTFNLLSGLAAVVGAIATIAVGTYAESITNAILPIAAGGFIYIASADIFPRLNNDNEGRSASLVSVQLSGLLVGIIMMSLLA